MEILLGLLVAAALGTADFFGGSAGRKVGALRALTCAHLTGLVLLGALLLITWQPVGNSREIGLAALGGLALCSGTGFLYRGLTIGRMTVVAPVTAAVVSIFTVILGLARNERPSALALSGAFLAIAATIVVSRPSGDSNPSGNEGESVARASPGVEVLMSTLAGCSFGAFQTVMDEIGAQSGWGPIFMIRVVSGGLFGLAVLFGIARGRSKQAGSPPGSRIAATAKKATLSNPANSGEATTTGEAAAGKGEAAASDEIAAEGEEAASDEIAAATGWKAFKQQIVSYRNAIFCGILLLTAHIMLIEALELGMLSIVGPLTGLTPAFTAIAAWIVLSDPMGKYQWIGMLIALAGVLMVAFG